MLFTMILYCSVSHYWCIALVYYKYRYGGDDDDDDDDKSDSFCHLWQVLAAAQAVGYEAVIYHAVSYELNVLT